MTTHVNTPEKAHKLFELIEYYEVCNRAEGPRSIFLAIELSIVSILCIQATSPPFRIARLVMRLSA